MIRCWLLGHRFYWLDVNHRHHCKRCGAVDEAFVCRNRLIRKINPRAGCGCQTCASPRPL